MFVKNKNERSLYSVFIKCESASIVMRVALGGRGLRFREHKTKKDLFVLWLFLSTRHEFLRI